MKLLIVEDNRSQASLLCRAFVERGHVVDACHSGEHACQQAQRGAYDVVLLDWNLPGLDGVTVCRELRRVGNNASVLMVSVRSDVADKVTALEAGADDYVVKPVDMHELIARVQAVARRRVAGGPAELRSGAMVLSERERSVRINGAVVELTHREFTLLAFLMRRAGETVSRSDIISHVWSAMGDLGSNVIDVYVRRLRGKLGVAGHRLKTVRGIGYRLDAADVNEEN
ncbi:MAG TPA: response regulator transcription factor [Polyangiaceae bacterium]|jgi:DNA-binding response OmpR family regulator|nr:response regulator transcription factor [Polyangiaceae bacterium]